jgi:peptidoglycan/xylan/chitin deacetylase (PgdA/CDA1 family)
MSRPRTTEPLLTATLLNANGPGRRAHRSKIYRAWVVLFYAANLSTLVLLGFQHYYWALGVLFLPAPWYAYQVLNPSARALGPVVTHFSTPRRDIWLTIDDGPDPKSTPEILDLLEAAGAQATFFLVGEKVLRHPEIVTAILQRGHTIGNHTHTHPCSWFWCGSARKTAAEIDTCADALRKAGAGETLWFRPPVGLKNHSLHRQLALRGLDLVLWSARGFDATCRKPAKALSRIAANLQPGAIILVHENIDAPTMRMEFLKSLLSHLASEGYACVIPPANALIRDN